MSESTPPDPDHVENPDAADLLWCYVERLGQGDKLNEAEIRREHPNEADELLCQLRALQEISADVPDEQGAPLGTLGDYTLRRQIGRGGMGVVYEAWENSMDRAVALKVLPAGIAADTRASARFLREAQTAGKLSHPNVVPVYFTGVKEQTPFYAMEFVDGETLAQLLARIKEADDDTETPFGPKNRQDFFIRLAAALADVADGLQHAHSKGITHRDIKPSNLILDRVGRLRILDFGLARLEGHESLTLAGDLVGTPAYMSPEQARKRQIPVDHRTDVYSLGATMYEALCGGPPFRGKDHAETLSQIIERDPVELRKVNPRVPIDLETIVFKCLRKDATDRYGTAEALGQDLKRYVRGEMIEARPPPPLSRLARRAWQLKWRAAVFLAIVAPLIALAFIYFEPNSFRIGRVTTFDSAYSPIGRVSRSGRYIALIDWTSANIGLHDFATKTSEPLTRDADHWHTQGSEGAAVSPDGTRVAYSWFTRIAEAGDAADAPPLRWEVRVIARDGSGRRTLLEAERGDHLALLDWSPDSRSVLIQCWPREGGEKLLLVQDAAEPSMITLWQWSTAVELTGLTRFSPDGRFIAYSRREPEPGREHDRDIFLLDRLGGPEEIPIVVRKNSDERLLGWTSEGILYASDGARRRTLYHLRVDATGRPEDSAEIRIAGQLSVQSGNGTTETGAFLFSTSASVADVFLANLAEPAESKPWRIESAFAGTTMDGDWSPDGTRLAYRVSATGRADYGLNTWLLAIYDIDSGRERILSVTPRFRPSTVMRGPRWSPDGRSLLVCGWGEKEGRGMYSIDANTGVAQLLEAAEKLAHPVWSPRGDAIYLATRTAPEKGEVAGIRRVALRAGVKESFFRFSERVGVFDVSIDDRQLAVASNGAVYLQATAGGDPEVLVDRLPDGLRSIAWHPSGRELLLASVNTIWRVDRFSRELREVPIELPGRIRWLSLHADGEQLALSIAKESTELWAMEGLLLRSPSLGR